MCGPCWSNMRGDQNGGRTMKTNRRRYLVGLLALSVLALLALQKYDNRRCAEKRPATGSSARLQLQSNGSDCQRACGNVSIPYPFGLSPQCAFSSYFVLDCRTDLGPNLKSNLPGPWPVLTHIAATSTLGQRFSNGTITNGLFEVNFLPVTQIQSNFILIDTTNIKAMGCEESVTASLTLDTQSPYMISERNVFIVVSCRAQGSAEGDGTPWSEGFSTTCGPVSCVNQFVMPYCGFYDCCIQTIGLTKTVSMTGLGITFAQFTNCGYSTVLYPDSFVARGEGVGGGYYGVHVYYFLQRGPDNQNCSEAAKDSEKFECSMSANCSNSFSGYYCHCILECYTGDGYKNGTGCKGKLRLINFSCLEDCDLCPSYINECLGSNNCSSIATCVNTNGSYWCKCPDLMEGNGLDPQLDFRGNNCTWIDQCKNKTKVCSPDAECAFDISSGDLNCTCQGGTIGDGRVNGTGVSVGSVVAFIIINSILLWYFFRRRRLAFDPAIFSQHELLNEIENKEGAKYCKLFTFSELREATKDFSVELGAGGFGTVFEGTLRDGTKVAIKKAKHGMGETRNEAKQFVNEIVILSQLNHRNLVNLLGCCLETRVPVLVYEFVSNGNLHEQIQMKRQTEAQRSSEALVDENSYFCHPPLNWTLRLKIAIEAAEALAYLHWGTSPPVYHRDVKCANILLDDTYNVKVADFGLSKLVPLEDTDAYAVPTAIQGTSYCDRCYESLDLQFSLLNVLSL
ncbi:protein MpRLK-Pelle_WAK4 [Marchantia polymorpha subsp. ruderalis]|uniref:Protein kinase domain-containing protein n=1 Tax=Marchantia polymorpha subsp. ruderalis TaxID=1480154 RepID=A0AAF6BT91_MARPO|nr:hypothetical protein Mp_6g18070 [Marchantia polymorpha subsp. ruderalis]